MLNLLSLPSNLNESKETLRVFIEKVRPHFFFVESPQGKKLLDQVEFRGEIHFHNEHTKPEELQEHLEPLLKHDAALMSDGGMPSLSDPGFELVKLCHEHEIPVQVHGVHSPILHALLYSGANANQFMHHGYFPHVKKQPLAPILHPKTAKTHVLIETPYRMAKSFEHLWSHVSKKRKFWLSVILNVGTEEFQAFTGDQRAWKKHLEPARAALKSKPLGVFVLEWL